MVFQLARSAEKNWLKIRGPERLKEIAQGRVFCDGLPLENDEVLSQQKIAA
jgi:hypothetical protein